ncbi:MAG: NnrS family protein [Rhizobacter sp.]|nr:NnrS family protein [Rhizobacter sp.]
MKTIPIRAVAASPPAETRWRAARLLNAPHRLAFFAAGALLAASGLWWAVVLVSRAAGVGLAWALPPSAAHAVFMAFGFMPLFITGFWFTAGPRWLRVAPVPARGLLVPVLAMALSWCVAVPGFHLSPRIAGVGLGLGAAGWTWVCLRSLQWLRRSPEDDRLHAGLITLSCTVGALAWWCAAVAAAAGQVLLLRSAAWAALWCFAAPTFAVASHRMIPFFEAGTPRWLEAWRPLGLLWVWGTALWWQGGLSVAALWAPSLPAAVWWASVAVEAPAAGLLLWLALRWGLMQNLRLRLIAMLHTGFLWLGVALALAAVSHARMAWAGPQAGLGLAPLHAMTVGYLGTSMLAMVTRVASAHSGRTVAADDMAWYLHGVLQIAAVARVTSALWAGGATALGLVAIAAWCAATGAWAWRQGRWLGQPRADGRPG